MRSAANLPIRSSENNQRLQEGLFFRPRLRHWISRDVLDDRKLVFFRPGCAINEYAASPVTYFGLNPIFFAARCVFSALNIKLQSIVILMS
jgi:hypothetical protein